MAGKRLSSFSTACYTTTIKLIRLIRVLNLENDGSTEEKAQNAATRGKARYAHLHVHVAASIFAKSQEFIFF